MTRTFQGKEAWATTFVRRKDGIGGSLGNNYNDDIDIRAGRHHIGEMLIHPASSDLCPRPEFARRSDGDADEVRLAPGRDRALRNDR